MSLDEFPKTFYQVQVGAIGWDMVECTPKLSSQFRNSDAFLISGIVQNDMYRLSRIRSGYFAKHLLNFFRFDIAVICYCQNIFRGIINRTKDVVAFPPGKREMSNLNI